MSATMNTARLEPRASAGWWPVLLHELHDLWVGGKAPYMLILFSVLLGVMSYVFAANGDLNLLPPKEMVDMMLQAAISVGLFISLIIGADSVSGERERATLEALLLTPVSRRQIVAGKFLAAVSPWPVAMLLTWPHMALLANGEDVLGQALLWGTVLGTLLCCGFAGVGMLASIWSNSNKASMSVGLTVFILFLIPTQFPGGAQTGVYGRMLKRVNPMESTNHFLSKILVNNRTPDEYWPWLIAPVAFAVLVCLALFWYAGPGLRLEGGRASRSRAPGSRAAGLLAVLGLSIALASPAVVEAQEEDEAPEDAPGSAQVEGPRTMIDLPLKIALDKSCQVTKTGDEVRFTTEVMNHGSEASPPLIVAMNIINLAGDGDPVDPEDWSPERTQYIEAIAPGRSVRHDWKIDTILEGDYMVYMVVVPEPEDPNVTSQPVTSSGIHVTVHPFVRLNPGGVLPLAVGMPGGLLAGTLLLRRWRRRSTTGGAA